MKTKIGSRSVRRVAVIGNYTPRQCGIATFTADLSNAIATKFPQTDCFAVAMNDRPEGYDYPVRVRCEVNAADLSSYKRAANFINASDVDVVCLQHEYGIFGGEAGRHILSTLNELRMPVVTTLHTILRKPSPEQCKVMKEITDLSERLVVMSQRGAKFLHEVHDIDEAKIDLVHHGIPNIPSSESARYKKLYGMEGKTVILTFGLLSPDKGIENVIEAMPAIIERFPEIVYVVLGATHPHIKGREGEAYRHRLEDLARNLGVASNVVFRNEFVSIKELTQFLAAADIYITPYLKKEQITSGTLAYAVGSGKVVISTPYYYAEELLADGRGVLVPWRDSKAISQEILDLLENPSRRAALQNSAASFGREMVWPAVACRYMEAFENAVLAHSIQARNRSQKRVLQHLQPDLKVMKPIPRLAIKGGSLSA